MSRPGKKTTVKKKSATASPSKRPTKKSPGSETFDTWAESLKVTTNRCSICRSDAVAETVNALLQAMIRKRAYRIAVRDIRSQVEKNHPSADVGQRAMERHLRVCVRPLYERARGRTNG